ncbi:unnamed protein product [Arabis nemorensis]|uniref:Uncharacterized protein n=1 Tax=Arabis nemorensis TaxID=586526 RepID=A0A565BJD2_9BRAS|nr:unnamed protein product [Arabis nemorensis]
MDSFASKTHHEGDRDEVHNQEQEPLTQESSERGKRKQTTANVPPPPPQDDQSQSSSQALSQNSQEQAANRVFDSIDDEMLDGICNSQHTTVNGLGNLSISKWFSFF